MGSGTQRARGLKRSDVMAGGEGGEEEAEGQNWGHWSKNPSGSFSHQAANSAAFYLSIGFAIISMETAASAGMTSMFHLLSMSSVHVVMPCSRLSTSCHSSIIGNELRTI